jgi:hypothetical protein
LLGTTSIARAQSVDDATRAAARSLGTTGVSAYQAGDYETAHDKLEKAYQVLKAPSLGLWSARALAKVGKLVEAGERYTEVTRLSISGGDVVVQKQAQADAQSELDALVPQIPTIVLQIEGADASAVTLTLDGQPLSSVLVGENRPVNPGPHHVEGTLGSARVTQDVTVAVGQRAPVLLHFEPRAAGSGPTPGASSAPAANQPQSGASPPTPTSATSAGAAALTTRPRSPLNTVGWVTVGVGGAAVAVGAITGALAAGKEADIKSNRACSNLHCLPSETDAVNSYNSLRTLSSIGFIAGGVLAATGVVLLLTSRNDSPGLALEVSPNATILRGAF